jgi:hypothetical protein
MLIFVPVQAQRLNTRNINLNKKTKDLEHANLQLKKRVQTLLIELDASQKQNKALKEENKVLQEKILHVKKILEKRKKKLKKKSK